MTDGLPTVVLVDDHDLLRAGARAQLDGYADVVGEAADVASALAVIVETKPDVVLHASYDNEAILFARTYKQFKFAPRGTQGGRDGAAGAVYASDGRALPSKGRTTMRALSQVTLELPGGGCRVRRAAGGGLPALGAFGRSCNRRLTTYRK